MGTYRYDSRAGQVIEQLHYHPGFKIKELAPAMGVDVEVARGAVNKLVKSKYVEFINPKEKTMKLTEAGEKEFEAMNAEKNQLMEAGSAQVSSPPEPSPAPKETPKTPEAKETTAEITPEVDETKKTDATKQIEDWEPVTASSLGTTAQQIFMNMGVLTGVKRELIRLTASMIWAGGGNCYDLNWVWKQMQDCDISYDLRSRWIHVWKSYVVQQKPEWRDWEPPSLARVEAEEKVEKAAAAKEAGASTAVKEWLVGAQGPIKVGTAAGLYSFEEAQGVMALNTMKLQAEAAVEAAKAGHGGQEKFSELLTALKPFIEGKKEAGEGGQEKISEIITALAPYISKGDDDNKYLKELLEEKLAQMFEHFAGGQGEKEPWYETVPAMITAFTSLGPTLRTILGIPDTNQLVSMIESRFPKQNGLQPYQVVDSEGKPMVMDLNSILSIKRFDREQAREDDKHKHQMDMMGGVRDFLGKISAAAARMGESE